VMFTVTLVYFISAIFQTLNLFLLSRAMVCNNLTHKDNLDLNEWCTLDLLSREFYAYVDPL
jgi:hypothetical protein